MKITFKLNDEKRSVDVELGETLLEVLRERIGVKSPKCGCDRGDCGSCTILFDGKSVRSCLILGIEADGHEITTLEGLAKDGLTKLQKAFHEKNAFQCGFCAPGIVISATEFVESRISPTNENIKEAIGGNLCRCTGYEPIIQVIKDVAEKAKR